MTRRVPDDLEPSERAFFDAGGRSRCPRPDLLLPAIEGVLPAELGPAVRAHVEACPACRELVTALSGEAATDAGEDGARRLLARVAARREPQRRTFRVAAAVAAAVIAAAGLAVSWLALGPEPGLPVPARAGRDVTLPAPAYALALEKPAVELPPGALLLRGGSPDPAVAALVHALEPYRRDDYLAAARGLEAVTAAHPDDRYALFYLGASRLLAGRPADAVSPLTRTRRLSPEGSWLWNEATWYLAVASERSGDRAGAVSALADLCNRPGRRGPAACEGLQRLTPSPQSRRQEESGGRIAGLVAPGRGAVRAGGRGAAAA